MPTNKTVKFHLIKGFPDQITLPPLASKKLMPQWFKNIPQFVKHNDDEIQSVKKCIPFLDAFTSGYIIPFQTDIEYMYDEIEISLMLPLMYKFR